jgi:hypothetical protein
VATEDGRVVTRNDQGAPADGGYDLIELRQRIAGSFSGAELRLLAQELGVAEREAGAPVAADIARDVVRHFERAHRIEDLVDELRRRQPLVEWPMRRPASTVPDPGADLALPDLPLVHAGELAELEPDDELSYEVTQVESPPSSAQPHSAQPHSGQPVGGLRTPPPVPPLGGPLSSSPWPGTTEVRERSTRGIDPKILVIVSGLTLAIAVVAFVAGLSWSGDAGGTALDPGADAGAPAETADPESPALAADTDLGDGIGGKAARAFRRGLLTVARKCELGDDVAPTVDIFAGVYRQCGPPPSGPAQRAGARPRQPAGAAGAVAEPEELGHDGPQAIATTDTPTLATPGAACLSSCSDVHGACGAACGAEPTKGSEYEAFQACRSKCMSAYSKCRLRCQ